MKPMDLLCYVKICFGVLITSWFDKGDSQFRMENICMFEDFLQREYHSEWTVKKMTLLWQGITLGLYMWPIYVSNEKSNA